MRTTEQWWAEVSNDEDRMIDWLKAQYHGEITAADRIIELLNYPDITTYQAGLIERIAKDELKHAMWVKELLESRGIEAKTLDKEERYWDKTLPKNRSTFSYMCAVGYLAETMRLERITLLANDKRFVDIAEVFAKIRPDEVFHTKAFKYMTTKKDILRASYSHKEGLNALGLVA